MWSVLARGRSRTLAVYLGLHDLLRSTVSASRAASGSSTCCSALAFVTGVADARAHPVSSGRCLGRSSPVARRRWSSVPVTRRSLIRQGDVAKPAARLQVQSGSSTTIRGRRTSVLHGVRVLGAIDDLAAPSPRPPPGRGADRDSVCLGRAARADRRVCRGARRPGPRRCRASASWVAGDFDLAGQLRPVADRGPPRPRAGRARSRRRSPATSGRDRARDGRRRLHRLGALPADRRFGPAR